MARPRRVAVFDDGEAVSDLGDLLIRLLGPDFAVEAASVGRGAQVIDSLWAVEAAAVAAAVPKRRSEFALGRHCARVALARVGGPPVAIPVGQSRQPLWPPGFIGSIAHSDRFVAAAVAGEGPCRSVGIDLEPIGAVGPGARSQILTPAETRMVSGVPSDLGGPTVDLATAIFTAKEAVYKATFPLSGQWLGFDEVEVEFVPDRPGGWHWCFAAQVATTADHDLAGQVVDGRLGLAADHLVSTVVLRG